MTTACMDEDQWDNERGHVETHDDFSVIYVFLIRKFVIDLKSSRCSISAARL